MDEKAKLAIAIEEAALEVQAYKNITKELENLALLHKRDETGVRFEKSALQHEAVVEDRKTRLNCLKNGHVLGEVILDKKNGCCTICPDCEEKVELIQKTLFDT